MTNHHAGAWRREMILASTETTLRTLQDANILDSFYLAGGTALALQFGHRLSLDLDFFSPDQFNEDRLIEPVQMCDGFALVDKAPHTLHGTIHQTKISFLG